MFGLNTELSNFSIGLLVTYYICSSYHFGTTAPNLPSLENPLFCIILHQSAISSLCCRATNWSLLVSKSEQSLHLLCSFRVGNPQFFHQESSLPTARPIGLSILVSPKSLFCNRPVSAVY